MTLKSHEQITSRGFSKWLTMCRTPMQIYQMHNCQPVENANRKRSSLCAKSDSKVNYVSQGNQDGNCRGLDLRHEDSEKGFLEDPLRHHTRWGNWMTLKMQQNTTIWAKPSRRSENSNKISQLYQQIICGCNLSWIEVFLCPPWTNVCKLARTVLGWTQKIQMQVHFWGITRF